MFCSECAGDPREGHGYHSYACTLRKDDKG